MEKYFQYFLIYNLWYTITYKQKFIKHEPKINSKSKMSTV